MAEYYLDLIFERAPAYGPSDYFAGKKEAWKSMKTIVYVILHYRSFSDTVECVESVLKLDESYCRNYVVVLDNGSPDDSFVELSKRFSAVQNVTILHNEENLGFARGNNVGFRFAKTTLAADFIVLLNNDTVITQERFSAILMEKYATYQYAVLGPDIITADGLHQNPLQEKKWTIAALRFDRLKNRIRILLCLLHLECVVAWLTKPRCECYRAAALPGDVQNTMLHGACLVFSPKYLAQFDGLDPTTFLYREEDILRLYAQHYRFLMMYSGALQVYHKEHVSTNMANKSLRRQQIERAKHSINSSYAYERIKRRFSRQ